MITGTLVGSRELVAKMTAYGPEAKTDMDATVDKLGLKLQRLVQRDYLTGQVLHVRTGRLRASIARDSGDTRSHFESTPLTSTTVVGTNVSYGRAWEYGFHGMVPVKAHIRHSFHYKVSVHGLTKFGNPEDGESAGISIIRKRTNKVTGYSYVNGYFRNIKMDARPFLMPALLAFKLIAIEQMRLSLKHTAARVFK